MNRAELSAAVEPLGWRYLLDAFQTSVPVTSSVEGVAVATVAVTTCGDDADAHLRVDVRSDRVELSLQDRAAGALTVSDTELAGRLTRALAEQGWTTAGAVATPAARPVQALEIAIDAMDIAAIRPFWRAVLAYVDDPVGDAVVDPAGQGPAVWFQQMDVPRPQRNRIHLDITVSHDEAPGRLQAALDAGGVLVSDAQARSFWILADVEGNEICICTWQDRDKAQDTE